MAGRAGQLRGQLKAVLEREADVIALQEIREATYPAWREGLLAEGYSVVSAVDLSRRVVRFDIEQPILAAGPLFDRLEPDQVPGRRRELHL